MRLHANEEWAAGYAIGVHCLRHSVARLLDGKRLHYDATALWLGDDPKGQMGTIATYLRSPFADL